MNELLPQTLDALADEVASVNEAYSEFIVTDNPWTQDDPEKLIQWRDRMAQTTLLVQLEIAKQLGGINENMRALNRTMDQVRSLIDIHVME